jgi:hypothetical protein
MHRKHAHHPFIPGCGSVDDRLCPPDCRFRSTLHIDRFRCVPRTSTPTHRRDQQLPVTALHTRMTSAAANPSGEFFFTSVSLHFATDIACNSRRRSFSFTPLAARSCDFNHLSFTIMKLSILSLLSLTSAAVSAIDINVDDPGKQSLAAAPLNPLLTPRSID